MRPPASPARYAPARCHPLVWRRAARDICFRSHALPRPSSGTPCRVAGLRMASVRVSGARRRWLRIVASPARARFGEASLGAFLVPSAYG